MNYPVKDVGAFLAEIFCGEVPKYLTREEVHRVINVAKEEIEKEKLPHKRLLAKRNLLLLLFLWQTGARISEALAIKVADIDRDYRRVRLRSLKRRPRKRRKNNKNGEPTYLERVIPLKAELMAELLSWIIENRLAPQDPVFFSSKRGRDGALRPMSRENAFLVLRSLMRKAGIPSDRCYPHVLRHSFAVNLLVQGVNLITIQKLMGHGFLRTTMKYMQIVDRETDRIMQEVDF